jgi:hypothetical protein
MGVSIIRRNNKENVSQPPPAGYQFAEDGTLVPAQDSHSSPPVKFQIINPDGQVKPFISPSSSPSGDDVSAFSKMHSAYETYQKIMSHPLTKGMAKLTQDSSFRDNAMKVIAHPNRMSVLYCELGWFLVFLIIRANVMSRIDGFVKRFLAGLFLLLIFWVGSTMVPMIIFGRPYFEIYRAMFNAFFG